jgi:hypothetical protein
MLVGGDVRGRHPFVEHGLVAADVKVGRVADGADQLIELGRVGSELES